MDQLHHQKAKSGFEFPMAALDPEEIVRQWQNRASKLLHAQERIAQGVAAAVRAQLRYSQEFMASHMKMQWEVTDTAHLSEQTRRDIENFAAMIKEVSGEIRSGFAEAGELLEVKPLPKPQAAPAPAAVETSKPVAAHPVQKIAPPAAAPAASPSKPVAAHLVEETKPSPAKAAAPKPAPTAAKAAPARIKRPVSRAKPRA